MGCWHYFKLCFERANDTIPTKWLMRCINIINNCQPDQRCLKSRMCSYKVVKLLQHTCAKSQIINVDLQRLFKMQEKTWQLSSNSIFRKKISSNSDKIKLPCLWCRFQTKSSSNINFEFIINQNLIECKVSIITPAIHVVCWQLYEKICKSYSPCGGSMCNLQRIVSALNGAGLSWMITGQTKKNL